MAGVAHVALALALCPAVRALPPTARVKLHVGVLDRLGNTTVTKDVSVERGDEDSLFAEFDSFQGEYEIVATTKSPACAAARVVALLPDRSRRVAMTLDDGPVRAGRRELLMDGDSPASFLYAKPAYVLVDHAVACNGPIGTPTPAPSDADYENDSYYLRLFPDSSLAASDPTMALRLRTPTGLFHYVRVPIPYAESSATWPGNVRFDISEDMLDGLATEKTDVLLCPKLWETKVR